MRQLPEESLAAFSNDSRGGNTKFYTKSPSIEVDAYILKVFTFRTDYSYNNFSNDDKSLENTAVV